MGIGALFAMILLLGIQSVSYVRQLSHATGTILAVLSCISVVYRFFTFTQRTCMPLARAYASAGAMPPVPVSFSYQK